MDEEISSKRFSRLSFRNSGINLDEWPMVDVTLIDIKLRDETQQRISALRFYLETNATVSEVQDKWGVSKTTLFRMIGLCMNTMPDGTVIGFRAAMPHARFSSYHRRKSVDTMRSDGRGSAGAFARLRETYPGLQEWLDTHAKVYRSRKKGGEYFVNVHEAFLKECESVGIKDDQYPLNRKAGGSGALRTYLIDRHKHYQAEKEKNSKLRVERDLFPPMSPLDEVQVDGHNLDIRLVISELDAYGEEVLYEILRVWLIAIKDTHSRCVLGHSIALGHTYDHIDILQAVYNSLAPHKQPLSVIPDACYHKDGGFPSQNISLEWRTWLSIKLDNAMAHKARHVQEVLAKRVGCVSDFGPPHEPNDRAIIERFFEYVAQNFSHRIIGTTGSSTNDEIKARLSPTHPDGLKLLITLDELKEVVDIVLSNYNGRPHSGIQGHTPLGLFKAGLSRDALLPDRVRAELRRENSFIMEYQLVKVRSSAKYGGAYVNFCYLKYKNSDVLRSDSAGMEVTIGFLRRDVSTIWLFDSAGVSLGILTPPAPWCNHPHSLNLQAEMQRAVRRGQFVFHRDESVLHAYRRHKSNGDSINRKTATALFKNVGRISEEILAIENKNQNQVSVPTITPRKLTKGFIF
jgi:transposase InsO family protein